MQKRSLLSIEHGLALWQIYTSRFFHSPTRCQVVVFDFDAFNSAPVTVFASLLDWLGRPRPPEDIQVRLTEFFGPEHVHWDCDDADLQALPASVKELYLEIRTHVGPSYRDEQGNGIICYE